VPAPPGARALVVGGTAWHVVAADVDPSWVAAQVAADPIAAPLDARFLAAPAAATPSLLPAGAACGHRSPRPTPPRCAPSSPPATAPSAEVLFGS
jgi:hypothetical protein